MVSDGEDDAEGEKGGGGGSVQRKKEGRELILAYTPFFPSLLDVSLGRCFRQLLSKVEDQV